MGQTGPRDKMSVLNIDGNFQEWYYGLRALVLTKGVEVGLLRPDAEELRTDIRKRRTANRKQTDPHAPAWRDSASIL